MPTYQYACTECGHAFDQFQSFNEDSLTTCPECRGKLRKVFSAAGVVFKGSGFYKTDSRAGSSASSAGSNSASNSGSSSAGSSSSASAGSGSSAGESGGGSTKAAAAAAD